MRNSARLAALLIAGLFTQLPAMAADKGAALATVNGQSIPKSYFDAVYAEQRAQGAPDNAEVQTAVREGLIRQEILFQEARKKGIDKKGDIQMQLELNRREYLVRAFITDFVRNNPVSESRAKAEYEKLKPNLTEYKARHILVEKEEDARAIVTKLGQGESFETLASQSKDPGSKDKGGELGWSAPNAYVPEFGQALVNLRPGEYTRAPVKTSFGYHVIRLDETRTQPFDKVKDKVVEYVQRMQVNEMIQDLRAKAKVN